jgi:hypothetical protein
MALISWQAFHMHFETNSKKTNLIAYKYFNL